VSAIPAPAQSPAARFDDFPDAQVNLPLPVTPYKN
jgi:hypothetical protein